MYTELLQQLDGLTSLSEDDRTTLKSVLGQCMAQLTQHAPIHVDVDGLDQNWPSRPCTTCDYPAGLDAAGYFANKSSYMQADEISGQMRATHGFALCVCGPANFQATPFGVDETLITDVSQVAINTTGLNITNVLYLNGTQVWNYSVGWVADLCRVKVTDTVTSTTCKTLYDALKNHATYDSAYDFLISVDYDAGTDQIILFLDSSAQASFDNTKEQLLGRAAGGNGQKWHEGNGSC